MYLVVFILILDRDRRTKNRASIAFDATKETPLDCAYENLVAEMDRVLSRRSYLSYTNDQTSMPPITSQQDYNAYVSNDKSAFNSLHTSRRNIYSISREAAESSTEMGRCIGELNKATATLSHGSSLKKIPKY